MKLSAVLLLALLSLGCAAKKQVSKSLPTAPEIPPKPKVRSIKAGDYILKGAEVLPDGTVVCHKPIQVIDSKKKSEDVTVYRCR